MINTTSAGQTYPHMAVDMAAVEHNIAVMAAWCAERGVGLAPHVKTTMSEPIVRRQVAAGAAWLTVATVGQAGVVLSWGYRRVLIANEVVEPAALERLRGWIDGEEAAEIVCLVDSAEGVERARRAFAASARGLGVMVDVGTAGGRTGVRDPRDARRLAELVHASTGLRLVGVAGYEGVVAAARDDATLRAVDEHCRRTAGVFADLAELYETDAPVFSMGGSVFPDRVVAARPERGTVLLRSGCYVTHDHGMYARVSPIPGLVPAITIRAVVLSAPEPGMVVLGAGKRELPHDAGLPVLLSAPGAEVTALFDHHAVVTGAQGLRVGDVAELGISHPCSAFARWDDEYVITRGGSRFS
ncbi:alanine racemase [Dactylosporangium sp. CA-092794]|uniref:alanine racemase n=1 Tax=Dactylosporangium sp. CA-092794 TaxID=3239929 RepID=UPI003D8C6ADE